MLARFFTELYRWHTNRCLTCGELLIVDWVDNGMSPWDMVDDVYYKCSRGCERH